MTETRTRMSLTFMAGAIAMTVAAACGSGSATVERASSTTAVGTTTTAPRESPDAALAEDALLTGADLGDGWDVLDARFAFPNSAAMARMVPECTDFAELVFEGGSDHGAGAARALGADPNILFTYVAVFPTVAGAQAMFDAVASSGFDRCWASFNGVAVPTMPLGVSEASYSLATPPVLRVRADESTVKYLEGTVTVGGSLLKDTCVCAFARVGRGVVEVHSVAEVFDPTRRSAVVQTAVDRLRVTLASR